MIRGMKKELTKDADVKNFNINAMIHNRFDIEVIDAKTGKLKQSAQAFNVICNNLWSRISSKVSYFSYIHYGGGSGTPSTSDTSLFSFIGYGSVSPTGSIDQANGVYSMKGSIQLSASTAAGKTITEVGIAYDDTASTLCTHAMLQDMNGNPISITKTDTDVVNIYATIFVHFNSEGYDNGSIRVCSSGGLLNCLAGQWTRFPNDARIGNANGLSYVNSGAAWYPAVLTESGGYTYYTGVAVTPTFDTAKRTITLKVGRFEAPSFNVRGIKAIHIAYEYSSGSTFQFYTSLIIKPGGDWFPESSIVNEAVGTGDGTTKDFALDFQYARNVVAYVDGVVDNAISVDYAPAYAVGINNYVAVFEYIRSQSTANNHIPDTARNLTSGGVRYFYNPEAERLGIASMPTVPAGFSVKASQDFVDWVEVVPYKSGSRNNVAIPADYQHYKYWRVENKDNARTEFITATPAIECPTKVLHFDNPPPEGAVITADYKCDCIAKDANHVFDVTVTIQLGEYTEAQ